MSRENRNQNRFDDDDVAGVSDRNDRRRERRVEIEADQVIIRANRVIIVDEEDDNRERRCNRCDNGRRRPFSWF